MTLLEILDKLLAGWLNNNTYILGRLKCIETGMILCYDKHTKFKENRQFFQSY
jgi:hypothetical protein